MQGKHDRHGKYQGTAEKSSDQIFQEKTDLLICGLIIETTPLSYFGQSRAANASFVPDITICDLRCMEPLQNDAGILPDPSDGMGRFQVFKRKTMR